MNLFDEITQRGLIENTTSEELAEKINAGGLTFYVGFDPTGLFLFIKS